MFQFINVKSYLREMIPEMFYFPDLYDNNNDLKFGKLLNGEEVNNAYVNDKNEDKFEKYEYISNLKNYLEFDNLKINKWIDLIFGINQRNTIDKIDKKEKRLYFSESMYIHLDEKKQEKDIKNPLNMQKYEFGIQPFQLFQSKFPEIKDKSEYFQEIEKYNFEKFRLEHSFIKGDKNKCVKCQGYNNICADYIKIINKNDSIFKTGNNKLFSNKKKQQKQQKTEPDKHFKIKEDFKKYLHYIFIGDVLGNVSIYKCKIKDNNINIYKEKEEYNVTENYKKIKTLTDHNNK